MCCGKGLRCQRGSKRHTTLQTKDKKFLWPSSMLQPVATGVRTAILPVTNPALCHRSTSLPMTDYSSVNGTFYYRISRWGFTKRTDARGYLSDTSCLIFAVTVLILMLCDQQDSIFGSFWRQRLKSLRKSALVLKRLTTDS